MNDVQYFADLTEMLKGLYKHYHYSAKALRESEELANVVEESCNRPGNVTGSRWAPHICALKVVCPKYRVIHAHMHQTAAAGNSSATTMQGIARNVVAKLESYKHLVFMFFIWTFWMNSRK